jgi:hypothetical protein
MKTRVLFLCITLFLLISGSAKSVSASPFRGPWEERGVEKTYFKQGCGGFNPLRSLVRAYRNYLSPIDGKTCPMYPSCSEYSLLCFEKHGFFVGWVMTCDRLLHEADEMLRAPVIYVNGTERSYDPVENNDFWWHSEH